MSISKREFNNFKIRLEREIIVRGLTCRELEKDTEAKNFVSNFANVNILDRETSNKIQNITYKFAHIEISKRSSSKEDSLEFPVINKYIGSELEGSFFFEKCDDGKIQEVFIETRPKIIRIN